MPIILTNPSPPAMPISSPDHWYDFTDISTLWQNTAGSTPITTPGQTILRCDDKGSAGDNVIHATTGPAYNTTLHPGGGATFATSERLFATPAAGIPGGGFSFFIVYSSTIDATNDWAFAWHGLRMGVRKNPADNVTAWMGGGSKISDDIITGNTPHAVIAIDGGTGAGPQTAIFNQSSLPETSTTASSGPDNSTDLVIGNFDSSGAAPLLGDVMEVVIETAVWNAGTITSVEDYIAEIYGIVWA